MTMFWFVAALFVLGALLMLMPPLLLSPPGVAAGGTGSMPARGTSLVLAALVPAIAVAVYLSNGSPHLATPRTEAPAAPAGDRHGMGRQQIEQMATALAERLQARPDDLEGWLMLGRSYTVLGRYRDGAAALQHADELRPNDATILADLADVTGMAQGRRLAGAPARLVQRALDADPKHPKALALAGSVAFEARDWAAARGYWQRLAAVLPPDSPMGASAQANIAEAERMEAGTPAVASAAPGALPAPAARLAGEIRVAPDLAARVQPGDTLYVYARANEGPRRPLAVLRRPAGNGPVSYTLDDTMALPGGARLSSAARVVVGARISRSGNATPQPGDLVGSSAEVDVRAQGVTILIDRVQP